MTLKEVQEIQDLFIKYGLSRHTKNKLKEGWINITIGFKENGNYIPLIMYPLLEKEYPIEFNSLLKIAQNIAKLNRQQVKEEKEEKEKEKEKKEKEIRRLQYLKLKEEFGKED